MSLAFTFFVFLPGLLSIFIPILLLINYHNSSKKFLKKWQQWLLILIFCFNFHQFLMPSNSFGYYSFLSDLEKIFVNLVSYYLISIYILILFDLYLIILHNKVSFLKKQIYINYDK